MAKDKLSVKQFAAMTPYSEEFINSHPAILALVKKAIAGDWFDSPQGQANFQRDFENTPWFKKNAASARGFLLAQDAGGADFDKKMETAQETIRARAVLLGAELDDATLNAMTSAYFMDGWGEQGREAMLDQALTGELPDFNIDHLNYKRGGPIAIMDALKTTARKNGVTFSEDYFMNAAKSVLAGRFTQADFDAEIRQAGASAVPLWGDRIKAGEDAMDIASPYINTMASVLEISPESIGLDDPAIKAAMGAVDDKGNPTGVGLWDFEKQLRQDDRWQYTKKANDEVSNLTAQIVSMFGFGG